MRKHPATLLSVIALVFLSTSTLAHAESICESGTFLSSELRAKWCGEITERQKRAPSKARPTQASRKPQSQDDDDEDDEGDDDEAPAPPPKRPTRAAPAPAARREQPPARAAEPPQEPLPEVPGLAAPARADNTGVGCSMKKLRFSADRQPEVPRAGEHLVWGGNATEGQKVINPPFASAFLRRAESARRNGIEVFAYLEGPCGDTDGEDDGETARCMELHQAYNARYARGTPDTDLARWKPFTFAQLKLSGKYQIGYCEIDNFKNNVTIPLVPIMKELKKMFDENKMYCRIVLKNLSAKDLAAIKKHVAPTPADAAFIAPFHIYEDSNNSKREALTEAMQALKGQGSTTIISTNSKKYGSRFTPNTFLTCGK